MPAFDTVLPERCDVLVVGAGISGLIAARELRAADPSLDVQVIDVATYAGGKLAGAEIAGVPIDVGAEAVIARRPEAMALIDELGLRDVVHYPGPAKAQVLANGRPANLPSDTLMGVPSEVTSVADSAILSERGLRRLSAPAPPAELGEDASITEVIGRQLGDEVVDRMVEPLLAGVYAGRADRLSVAATIPALWAQLQSTPSVMQAVREVRQRTPQHSGPVFATVDGGINRLPAEIIAQSDLSVTLGVPARSIDRVADGYSVGIGPAPSGRAIHARAVIVATAPQKATKLITDAAPNAARELAEVQTSTMAVIALAFRRSDVSPPNASGLLIPVSAGTAVKAFTFVTTKWPHLSDDLMIVRASIGRVGEEQVLQRDDAELIELARTDLRATHGIDAVPIDSVVRRWAGSLPQYDVGHLARVRRIKDAVRAVSGLAVAGATYDGVGIPGCINSGRAAAQQTIEDLRTMEERS